MTSLANFPTRSGRPWKPGWPKTPPTRCLSLEVSKAFTPDLDADSRSEARHSLASLLKKRLSGHLEALIENIQLENILLTRRGGIDLAGRRKPKGNQTTPHGPTSADRAAVPAHVTIGHAVPRASTSC